jgi:hypothetical protein
MFRWARYNLGNMGCLLALHADVVLKVIRITKSYYKFENTSYMSFK